MDEKRMTGVKSSGCNMEELQDASQASLEYLGSLCALFAKKTRVSISSIIRCSNRLEKYYTSLFTTFSINLVVFLSRTILYPPARCDKTQRETVAKNR